MQVPLTSRRVDVLRFAPSRSFLTNARMLEENGWVADTMGSPEIDAADVRLNRLLNLILETAVEALGFSAATISVRQQAEVSTVGATDQRLIELDDAQYQAGGPCVQTLDDHDPVLLRDVADGGETWEHYADTAAHLGVRSSLSLHIPTDSPEVAASLNLYSREVLDLEDRQIRSAETTRPSSQRRSRASTPTARRRTWRATWPRRCAAAP